MYGNPGNANELSFLIFSINFLRAELSATLTAFMSACFSSRRACPLASGEFALCVGPNFASATTTPQQRRISRAALQYCLPLASHREESAFIFVAATWALLSKPLLRVLTSHGLTSSFLYSGHDMPPVHARADCLLQLVGIGHLLFTIQSVTANSLSVPRFRPHSPPGRAQMKTNNASQKSKRKALRHLHGPPRILLYVQDRRGFALKRSKRDTYDSMPKPRQKA